MRVLLALDLETSLYDILILDCVEIEAVKLANFLIHVNFIENVVKGIGIEI